MCCHPCGPEAGRGQRRTVTLANRSNLHANEVIQCIAYYFAIATSPNREDNIRRSRCRLRHTIHLHAPNFRLLFVSKSCG